jgi:hypothetical protein
MISYTLKGSFRFLLNADIVMEALASEFSLEKRLKSLAQMQDCPGLFSQLSQCQKEELSRWASLSAQGKSVKALADNRIANVWLVNPELLKPSRFTTALRMRTNTTGGKVTLNRAKAQTDLIFRMSEVPLETLGHILGQYTQESSGDPIPRRD